ncbi:MAG: HAMP domain-containing sensor histidine kinase [Rhodocyclaceae bacterium]|nr:HAMP domain-containing sensor histidine kinase [Rhodocyclaceae bacterium]
MSFPEIAALTIHDVKNRLAELAGKAERRGDKDTVRTALEAAATLTQLLAFYKSENGILTPNVDAHAPADLVDELAHEAGGMGGIAIETDCGAAPTLAFYDETLVRMVLANALQNAMRHARSRIMISVGERSGQVEFCVRDDGPGYPASVLADGGYAAAVTREGTGLGLRLAKRIARLHESAGVRGDVALANQDGAVFALRLPR